MRWILITAVLCATGLAAADAKGQSDTPKAENTPTARGIAPRDPLQSEWQALKMAWTHRRAEMSASQQELHKERMAVVLAELRRRAATR